jgi:hypothetical protein
MLVEVGAKRVTVGVENIFLILGVSPVVQGTIAS